MKLILLGMKLTMRKSDTKERVSFDMNKFLKMEILHLISLFLKLVRNFSCISCLIFYVNYQEGKRQHFRCT